MLALWNRGHASGALRRRIAKANCAIRVEARSVMIFRLSTTPGTTSCSSPGIQVLGVLTHDDEIDVREPARDARQVPDRPEVRVEVERLAQAHVDAGDAFGDRCRHRALERHFVAFDRVEQLRPAATD